MKINWKEDGSRVGGKDIFLKNGSGVLEERASVKTLPNSVNPLFRLAHFIASRVADFSQN